jgi:hypothetical protein
VIFAHCGGDENAKLHGPGAMINKEVRARPDLKEPGIRLDLQSLKENPKLVAALKNALADDGVLIIIACGHVSDEGSNVDKNKWKNDLEAIAKLLEGQRKVIAILGNGSFSIQDGIGFFGGYIVKPDPAQPAPKPPKMPMP